MSAQTQLHSLENHMHNLAALEGQGIPIDWQKGYQQLLKLALENQQKLQQQLQSEKVAYEAEIKKGRDEHNELFIQVVEFLNVVKVENVNDKENKDAYKRLGQFMLNSRGVESEDKT